MASPAWDILIVGPQFSDLEAVVASLPEHGYGVRWAAGLQAALDAARLDSPDLVLLDAGAILAQVYRVCRQLKADPSMCDVSVLLIGPPDQFLDPDRVFASGAADYVSRPVRQSELRARIQTHLAIRGMRDQLAARGAQLQSMGRQHRDTEDALQRQNEFLNDILESLDHPFYVIDAADYRVEIANSAARAAGLAEEGTCYALTHGQSTPCHTPGHPCPLEEVKRIKKPVVVEHIHCDADGTERYVEVRSYPLLDDDGNVARIIEYVLDVTERRLAEEQRRHSEQQYRQLLDTLQEGIWVIDAAARTTFVNPRMADMLGYSVEEMQGRHLFEFMDESGIESAKRNLERRTLGIREQHDFRFVRRDGAPLYALLETSAILGDDGQYQGAIAGIQDITARRQMEQAVREAEAAADEARRQDEERRQEIQRRRQIAQAMQGVLAALNSNRSLDQVLDFVAAQATQVLGTLAMGIYRWSEEEGAWLLQAARGLGTDEIAPGGPPGAYEALAEAAASRQTVVVSHVPGSGPGRALLAVPVIVCDQVYGGAVVYYDPSRPLSEETDLAQAVSHQVALAVENARLKEEAQQAAIAAERSRLARDLHDSVTQALFSASLVAEVLPQVWRREPEEALKGLEELRLLTHSALADMRALLLELRPTTLSNTGLDDLIAQLAAAVTGRTKLSVGLDLEPVPLLPADVQVTFYRVCQEALQNIVKHAGAGHVAVLLRASPSVSTQQGNTWQGQILLQVSDDGRGFEPKDVEPDRMGLKIMRERAESVGGCLSIEARPNEGTYVTLLWESPERGVAVGQQGRAAVDDGQE